MPGSGTEAAIVAVTRAIAAFGEIRTAVEDDLRSAAALGVTAIELISKPLWDREPPASFLQNWSRLTQQLTDLNAGFEVWTDWYENRLKGQPLALELEGRCVALTLEQLAQSPSAVNAHLRSLREGLAHKQLNRVRAIFIGHGGVGKTSLIKTLHGEDVVEGREAMTKGIAFDDSSAAPMGKMLSANSEPLVANEIHEGAGVFTRVTDLDDRNLTVHFWDFGGQVMAHATHQFFLRAGCLYVIVLDARKERNANEEAEYWLEHVRAFGDQAPVLIVGNKADQLKVNLDLKSLRDKYPNVVDFYPLSCTAAKDTHKAEFERFARDFYQELIRLGSFGQRFTDPQFKALKAVQQIATEGDFLSHEGFAEICSHCGIADDGPQGQAQLLDLFDKLGIVMHFPALPYLTDYVLNPRWLTYGVYSIMYSERAHKAKGRLAVNDLVGILRNSTLDATDDRKRRLAYPPERCRLIVEAMEAFGVAFRLAHDPNRVVIPALLPPEQPEHGFNTGTALALRFDCKGFLPRHVLPKLIVDHHADIEKGPDGGEIVWQNGVLLHAHPRLDVEALVKADYHERNLDVLVSGSDAAMYLGLLRDGILKTLATMPELPFEENVRLRPDMRVVPELPVPREKEVWLSYRIVRTAEKNRLQHLPGPDGHMYVVDKVLAVMPLSPDLVPNDVFISYTKKDRVLVDEIASEIEKAGYLVWFDRELNPAQQFRETIMKRIESAKAVVVLWTEQSIGSKWVKDEAQRGDNEGKLICLYEPPLEIKRVPAPFSSNHHIAQRGDRKALGAALAALIRHSM
jgi:hypothetical protein